MYHNRTIEYLQAFDKRDWKSFKKFQSLNIKEGTDLHKLISLFFEHQKNLTHKSLGIEEIQNQLFPSKTRKSISNLFSQFTTLIRDFLVQEQLEIDEHYKKILLIQALNNRSLYDESNKLGVLMEKELTKAPIDYFNSLYLQLLNHHQYFSENPVKYSKMGSHLLQESINNARRYHEQVRSLYFLENENMKLIKTKSFEPADDDFEFDKKSRDKLVEITYHLYEVRINGRVESARLLKKILFEEHRSLSKEVLLNIYIILRMYFAKTANLGDLSMALESFELNKLIVEQSYFDYKGQVDSKRFIPVVELAVFLGKIDWAESFVKKYENSIDLNHRHITINLAKALICFGKKEYDQTLDILNKIYPKDLKDKSIIMRLTLISHLESYEDDSFFIQQRIENNRLFFYRHKRFLSKRIYESSNNFLKIIQMILQEKDREEIKNEMQKMKFIFYRLYLMKKLSE